MEIKWTKFRNFSEPFLAFPEGFHCKVMKNVENSQIFTLEHTPHSLHVRASYGVLCCEYFNTKFCVTMGLNWIKTICNGIKFGFLVHKQFLYPSSVRFHVIVYMMTALNFLWDNWTGVVFLLRKDIDSESLYMMFIRSSTHSQESLYMFIRSSTHSQVSTHENLQDIPSNL